MIHSTRRPTIPRTRRPAAPPPVPDLSLTPSRMRVLAAVSHLDGEALLTYPRQGIWRIGKNGLAAGWTVFNDLCSAGLIHLRVTRRAEQMVSITDKGRRRLAEF